MLNGNFNLESKKEKFRLILGHILGHIFKKTVNEEIPTCTSENISKEKIQNVPNKKVNLYDKYSTMDQTPLSVQTINTIALFKNVPKNIKVSKMGGNFEEEGTFLEKLTQYEVFINLLIDHSKGEKLPPVKFIIENWKYGDEEITTKIIRNFKKKGVQKGDIGQYEATERYYLKRFDKYK
jgi:hypothetical protein